MKNGFKGPRTRIQFVGMSVAALAATFASSEAQAQSAQAEIDSTSFDGIVVTARRRSEDIQKVPIAITVVTPETLQSSNIQSVGDLQYLSPSLSSGSRSSRDALSLNIRGQGQSAAASQPGVILYLNEVPLPVNQQGETIGGPGLLFDLEHVEILKGPQGTLFGRNSVGGAILVSTAQPKD